ncbi:MAG: pilus assembly PilX N-terminal domain-containing protein, partial [Candidatus Omnitrophica bacterium]|nr:pilus assembly PilX N-terminal domain-containing protein [Candidatus Omnitrophota bacterium]
YPPKTLPSGTREYRTLENSVTLLKTYMVTSSRLVLKHGNSPFFQDESNKEFTRMMRFTIHDSRITNRGAVLILTFMVMTTLTIIVVAFLSLTSIQTRAGGYDIASHKALWLAEAGLQKAFYTLKNDVNYQNNPTPISGSLGEGTYSVSVSKSGSNYTFTSLGAVGVMNRKITHGMSLTSSTLVRSIHADGSTLDFQNSTGVINGNVSCNVQIKNYSGMAINGIITQGFPMIRPTLDFDYYKNLAIAAGQYDNNAKTFANATYSGVWYVGGKVTVGSNAIINGTIIGDNYIEFAKAATNVQISPSPLTNYPALAAKQGISTSASGTGGDKVGLQNSTINGLVLAGSNITFDWIINSAINGTILAGNNITMSNGAGIALNYDSDIFAPITPGFTYSPGGSTSIVSQKDWNEIVPAI